MWLKSLDNNPVILLTDNTMWTLFEASDCAGMYNSTQYFYWKTAQHLLRGQWSNAITLDNGDVLRAKFIEHGVCFETRRDDEVINEWTRTGRVIGHIKPAFLNWDGKRFTIAEEFGDQTVLDEMDLADILKNRKRVASNSELEMFRLAGHDVYEL